MYLESNIPKKGIEQFNLNKFSERFDDASRKDSYKLEAGDRAANDVFSHNIYVCLGYGKLSYKQSDEVGLHVPAM